MKPLISSVLIIIIAPLFSTVLFHDTFERPDGSVGNGWTAIGPADVSIQGGMMRISATGGMGIYRDFPSQSAGTCGVRFDWMVESGDWLAYCFPNDIATHLMQDYQGLLYYDNNGLFNAPVQIGAMPMNTWVNVRMEMDIGDDTFSIWLDGTEVASDVPGNIIDSFYRWSFKAYPGASVVMWVDNFIMWDAGGTAAMISPEVTLDNQLPVVDLTAPDGGEQWYIGDTRDILWTASDSHFEETPVTLDFSSSGGSGYTNITTAANTGSHSWTVPTVVTENALVRIVVTDRFGNMTEDVSSSSFSIGYVPPQAPQGVQIDISGGVDAVVTWNPVTQNIYGNPITPDVYFVMFSETPEDDHAPFYFLGSTPDTTFTHPTVVQYRQNMFYDVIAWVDHDGRMPRVMETLAQVEPENIRSAKPNRGLTRRELLAILHGHAKREGGEQ